MNSKRKRNMKYKRIINTMNIVLLLYTVMSIFFFFTVQDSHKDYEGGLSDVNTKLYYSENGMKYIVTQTELIVDNETSKTE